MLKKETKRWLRALGTARILFEEEGYHCFYLDGIESLIRREKMYSPKISEDLVPVLYRTARSKRIPMTKLVNRIIQEYLLNHDMMEGGVTNHESEIQLGRLQGAEATSQHQPGP